MNTKSNTMDKTNAIPFEWLFDYMDNHFPDKLQSPGYCALLQLFHDYCKENLDNKS